MDSVLVKRFENILCLASNKLLNLSGLKPGLTLGPSLTGGRALCSKLPSPGVETDGAMEPSSI